MQIPQPRPNVPLPEPVAQRGWAARWGEWLVGARAHDEVEKVVDAVLVSPWLTTPWRECLAVDLSAQAGLDAPLMFEELHALAAARGTDDVVGHTVGRWMTAFQTTPEEALSILRVAGDTVPPPLADAVSAWAVGATRRERAEAVAPLLDLLPRSAPPIDMLNALQAHAAEHELLATLIEQKVRGIRRWSEADRRAVLGTWSALQVRHPASRVRLLRAVAMPFARAAQAGAELFVDYPDLLQDPPGEVREELRNAFRMRAQRSARLRTLLDETGIEKRSFFDRLIGR